MPVIFGQPLCETLPVPVPPGVLAPVALTALLARLARFAAVGLVLLGERERGGEQEDGGGEGDGEAHEREPNRWRAS